jgi:probable UDP-sugar transporter A4
LIQVQDHTVKQKKKEENDHSKLCRNYQLFLCTLIVEGTINSPVKDTQNNMMRTYIRPLGLPMIFAYCTLSGLAGVYNEWILKKYYEESLHVQNIYLYTYGSLLNLVPAVGIPLLRSQSLDQLNLFRGFSIYTWLIIVTQALNGLFMSVVIKHTSNIIRLFVISFSLVVTTILSVIVFHLTLNFYFIISFGSMICALWLYYVNWHLGKSTSLSTYTILNSSF